MKSLARFFIALLLCQTMALASITVDFVGNLKLGQTLTYTYNAQGDLASVTDRAGGVTKFTYATDPTQPHLLQAITDPRGVVVMSNQFDEYGRLTASADALGQATTQQFEPSTNLQTVTDRRGNRTVYTFDADGNITKVLNPLGQTSSYTFDTEGNELTTTNALGQTTSRTFDANGKQTSEANPLGHTTRTTYGGSGTPWQRLNPLSSTDARGNSTTYGYNGSEAQQPGAIPNAIHEPLGRSTTIGITPSNGNLNSLNIAGEASTYGYDALGRRTVEVNALGHTTGTTFDANGNQTSRTVTKTINGNPQSLTTTSTFDAENRLVAQTDPLGGTRSMTYNSAGKLTSQTNALGQKTSYSYDANARLTATSYPDGTTESTTFDAEGNETAKTDRAGRTTRMEFDALNRLVKTTYPDGTIETSTFDAAGRVTATTDRKGQASRMEYDAAGRQTAAVDATGIQTSQTFDANGNRTSTTVAARTTSFTYDALNRLTNTSYPDGSNHSSVYRPDNRKQSETDPRGLTTTYGYDTAGRLTSVTQSLNAGNTATTGYAYDETGAKTTQTDALGRTTTWTTDAGGRITSRKLGDGSSESNSFDLEGKRTGHTSFAGEQFTYQYNSQGQLTGMVVPAGDGANSTVAPSSVLYAYTPSGQVQSQQEQGATTLNGTQSYQFDANDRLVQSSSPLGQLTYTLDANGNAVERSVSNTTSDAGTATSTYDAAGRLTKVTAPDGKATRYSYDSAGRLILTERDLNAQAGQAQVLRTHQRYDSADRTVAIAHVKQTGATQTLLVGQALTRDAGGAVSRIDMYRAGFGVTPASFDVGTGLFSGTVARTQNFEFDANARLTRENRVDAATPALSLDTRYTYDAVGNRSTKTATSGSGTDTTAYTYDNADRLTQEQVTLAAGGTKTTAYTWDQNGNLATKIETGKATLYRFDPQNRLIDIRTGATQAAAQAASPSVSYAYDANGNRVKKTGPAGATGYLVDANQTYAQVALESTPTASTAYVWGNQLIRQTSAGVGNLFATANAANDVFPLQGHLNSSLGAIDANGNAVEQSLADAFGQLDTPTGLKQNHLYTGEYFDQDSQLLYRYNGFEQRAYKTGPTALIPTGAAYYVYNEAGQLLGEYAADGSPIYETVYLGSSPVNVLKQTGTAAQSNIATSLYNVYADHLATPRVITRATDEAIVWRWDAAEAFGATAPDQNPNNLGTFVFNQRLPGQVFDAETGLFQNHHREYNARLGRYIQSDPIGLAGGINTYAYVSANPLSLADPSGLAPDIVVCVYGVCTPPPPIRVPDYPRPSPYFPSPKLPDLKRPFCLIMPWACPIIDICMHSDAAPAPESPPPKPYTDEEARRRGYVPLDELAGGTPYFDPRDPPYDPRAKPGWVRIYGGNGSGSNPGGRRGPPL